MLDWLRSFLDGIADTVFSFLVSLLFQIFGH